jgi:hypothetical protein
MREINESKYPTYDKSSTLKSEEKTTLKTPTLIRDIDISNGLIEKL